MIKGNINNRVKWYITYTLFFLILLYAFILRENFLIRGTTQDFPSQRYITKYLASDAKAFYKYGLTIPYPCFTTARPPFSLILTRFAIKNFGCQDALPTDSFADFKKYSKERREAEQAKILYNHVILRYVSICYNLLSMAALFFLLLMVFGRFTALAATFFWAMNSYSIFFTYTYFRGDLVTFLNLIILTLLILLLRYWRKTIYLIIFSLGVIFTGICLVLTRLSAFTTLFLSLLAANIVQMFSKDWSKKILLATIIIYGLIICGALPYFMFNYSRTGSIAPFMSHHAKYWRNHEFVDKPGFPTRKEIQQDLYCGENLTFSEYIFSLHTFPEICKRYFDGYWTAFNRYLPELSSYKIFGHDIALPWLVILIPFALLIILIKAENRKEKLLVVLFGLIVLFPFAFLLTLNTVTPWYSKAVNIGVDKRFTLPVLPYFFICIGVVLNEFRIMLLRYFKKAIN